jgi:hypothetical protein
MESLDVKAALDSMLAFVAQNYLIAVLVLVGYCLGRWHARPKPRKPGPPLRPEMIELLERLEREEREEEAEKMRARKAGGQ